MVICPEASSAQNSMLASFMVGVVREFPTAPKDSFLVANAAYIAEKIGSSLTAVDLAGVTRLELAFALVMVAASTGLVLALGLADRDRSFALLVALGATPR